MNKKVEFYKHQSKIKKLLPNLKKDTKQNKTEITNCR